MITLKDPHILDDPFSAVYLSELSFQSHYKGYQDTYLHIAGLRIIINQRLFRMTQTFSPYRSVRFSEVPDIRINSQVGLGLPVPRNEEKRTLRESSNWRGLQREQIDPNDHIFRLCKSFDWLKHNSPLANW